MEKIVRRDSLPLVTNSRATFHFLPSFPASSFPSWRLRIFSTCVYYLFSFRHFSLTQRRLSPGKRYLVQLTFPLCQKQPLNMICYLSGASLRKQSWSVLQPSGNIPFLFFASMSARKRKLGFDLLAFTTRFYSDSLRDKYPVLQVSFSFPRDYLI